MDSTTRYRRLNDGPAGRIRELAISLLVPHAQHLPTKSALREAIAEALPGDAYAEAREAVFDKLVNVAKMGVSGMDRLEARGVVDEWTLKLASELEAKDALIPVEDEDTQPVDVSAVLDTLDNADPTQRNLRAVEAAAKQAELETNLARMRSGS
jgi:hypothetical protein